MLTEEAKKARIGTITSSVSAGCLGVDEIISPLESWLRIHGKGPSDDDASPELLKAYERGNLLEAPLIAWAGEQLDCDVCEAPFRRHPDHEWLGDSADALLVPRECGAPFYVAEAKTVALGGSHHYGAEGTDEIPTHALIQSHHHLLHWGDAESCVVPVIVGGYDFSFRMYRVNRNPQFEELLINKLGEWHHEYIVGDKPPPATWRDSDKTWLIRRYGGHRDAEPLASTPELEEWARKKALAAQRIKDAKEEEETAKNRLRELLGHHEETSGDWGKATWRRNKSSEKIDHEGIADELLALLRPEQAEQVITRHTHERLGSMVLRVNLSKALKKELGL